ncbi:DUF7260 family protein [Halosegnis rubeus]|jgi:hypothetical protein|uniref:DUF7260 domain-containing protein n=1 Tax=Halosegnis rubeus TaxID=2212850 RepID=A0A5N5UFX4_9EURY|nr:hypothetical protein [Halosegnis rubeus]KAB7517623.1 hypothetical protein DP108_08615 [Halosegnis rubeus]
MAQTAIEAVDDAREILRHERRRVADEREAFDRFARLLAGVESETPTATTGSRTLLGDGGVSAGARAVRDHYQSTVMSVPHYDSEYGDSYRESLAIEFGPDVAVALESGFDARTKQAVHAAARDAHADRVRFVDALDAEAAALTDYRETCLAIADERLAVAEEAHGCEEYGTLDALRTRCLTLEADCDGLAGERQQAVRACRADLGLPDAYPNLQEYLYAPLETDYPVLAATTDIAAQLRDCRQTVEERLAVAS